MIGQTAKDGGPLVLDVKVREIDLEAGSQFAMEVMAALTDHARVDAVRAFLMGVALATTSAVMSIGAHDDVETLHRHLAAYLVDDMVGTTRH